MSQVIININHREYAIACENGQEASILKLSRILDEKAKLLTSAVGQINENQLLVMIALIVADELNDAKQGLAPSTESPIVNPNTINPEDIITIDESIANNISQMSNLIKSLASQIK